MSFRFYSLFLLAISLSSLNYAEPKNVSSKNVTPNAQGSQSLLSKKNVLWGICLGGVVFFLYKWYSASASEKVKPQKKPKAGTQDKEA